MKHILKKLCHMLEAAEKKTSVSMIFFAMKKESPIIMRNKHRK